MLLKYVLIVSYTSQNSTRKRRKFALKFKKKFLRRSDRGNGLIRQETIIVRTPSEPKMVKEDVLLWPLMASKKFKLSLEGGTLERLRISSFSYISKKNRTMLIF